MKLYMCICVCVYIHIYIFPYLSDVEEEAGKAEFLLLTPTLWTSLSCTIAFKLIFSVLPVPGILQMKQLSLKGLSDLLIVTTS